MLICAFSRNIFCKNSPKQAEYRAKRLEQRLAAKKNLVLQRHAQRQSQVIPKKEVKEQPVLSEKDLIIASKTHIIPQVSEQLVQGPVQATPSLQEQEAAIEQILDVLESIQDPHEREIAIMQLVDQGNVPEEGKKGYIAFLLQNLEKRLEMKNQQNPSINEPVIAGKILTEEDKKEILSFLTSSESEGIKESDFFEGLQAAGVSPDQLRELYGLYQATKIYVRTKDIYYGGFGTSFGGTFFGKASNYSLAPYDLIYKNSKFLEKQISEGFGTLEKPIDFTSITIEDLENAKKAFKSDQKVSFQTVSQKNSF